MELNERVPSVLTVKQAAEVLQLSPDKVYQMVAANELKAAKFGKSIRITAVELNRLLTE